MRNILAKEGRMTQLGNFFPFERMNLIETWSGDAQALYVCKLQLELRNSMCVEGERAGSVKIDGPSVPSGKCCSSCPSTTGPISLLLVETWSQYTPLRCLSKVSSKISGVSQNGRERPQKGNRHPFGLHLGHYRPWWRGDKLGNPLKVNISWFMTLFSEFFITSSAGMNISCFFSDFMGPTLWLLLWDGPNPRLGPHLRDGKSWLNLCNIPYGECSCDRSHFLYRQASLARAFGTGGNISPH